MTLDCFYSVHSGVVAKISGASRVGPFWDGVHLRNAESGLLDQLFPASLFSPRFIPHFAVIGAGCDVSEDSARLKAIAECLERYSLAVYSTAGIITEPSKTRAGVRYLDLEGLPRPLSRMRCDDKATDDFPRTAIRWLDGVGLCDWQPTKVPFSMVRVFARHAVAESFHIRTTAGAAAQVDFESAVLAGCYELIERDAVAAIWILRLPLDEIDIGSVSNPALKTLCALDQLSFVDQRFFLAWSDLGVPVVYAVRTLRPPIGNDVIVTAACDDDIERAMLKARVDASGQQQMRISTAGFSPYSRFYSEPGIRVDRMLDRAPDLHFLTARPRKLDLKHHIPNGLDTAARLRVVTTQFARLGYDLAAVDVTCDEVRQCSLRVVKVVAPTLLQPPAVDDEPFYSDTRLRAWGWDGRADNLNMGHNPF